MIDLPAVRWLQRVIVKPGCAPLGVVILLAWLGGGCRSNPVRPPAQHGSGEETRFPFADEVRQGDGFMVVADRRVFATMAFLNATGFDAQPESFPMHPVRKKVRARMMETLARHPDQLREWRRYVRSRSLPAFAYQDFSLSLRADYPFDRIHPDAELGYPLKSTQLGDFPKVLNNFWVTAELTNLWNEVKPVYLAELAKYDLGTMQREMTCLWRYLRMPRRDTWRVVQVPNLLDSYYTAIGAHYEPFYYCVESPGSHTYGLNLHEYLHSVVNPLIQSNFANCQGKLTRYYQASTRSPMSKHYREPVAFASECLVRALDARVRARMLENRSAMERTEEQVAALTEQGLTLLRPLYESFGEYEKGEADFSRYLPTLLARLPELP